MVTIGILLFIGFWMVVGLLLRGIFGAFAPLIIYIGFGVYMWLLLTGELGTVLRFFFPSG